MDNSSRQVGRCHAGIGRVAADDNADMRSLRLVPSERVDTQDNVVQLDPFLFPRAQETTIPPRSMMRTRPLPLSREYRFDGRSSDFFPDSLLGTRVLADMVL